MAVINDWNLNDDDLARYKVLILPNTACLDDGADGGRRAVRRRQAAGWWRSLDASLFDEFGDAARQLRPGRGVGRRLSRAARPVGDARRSKTLDVNFAQSIGPDYWEKRKNVFDFKQDTQSFFNQGA